MHTAVSIALSKEKWKIQPLHIQGKVAPSGKSNGSIELQKITCKTYKLEAESGEVGINVSFVKRGMAKLHLTELLLK